jgi:hypothetical protein
MFATETASRRKLLKRSAMKDETDTAGTPMLRGKYLISIRNGRKSGEDKPPSASRNAP